MISTNLSVFVFRTMNVLGYVCVCCSVCAPVNFAFSFLIIALIVTVAIDFFFISLYKYIFFSLVNLIYCVFLSFLCSYFYLRSIFLILHTYTLLPNFIFNTMHTLNSWKINRETSQKRTRFIASCLKMTIAKQQLSRRFH